jgi:hypothetical protein
MNSLKSLQKRLLKLTTINDTKKNAACKDYFKIESLLYHYVKLKNTREFYGENPASFEKPLLAVLINCSFCCYEVLLVTKLFIFFMCLQISSKQTVLRIEELNLI